MLTFADDLVMRREGQRASVKNGPVRCKTGVNKEELTVL